MTLRALYCAARRGYALSYLFAIFAYACIPCTVYAADKPTYKLRIDAPSELATLLETYLDIARYRENSAESINDSELARLTAAAPEQARALLRTEGYFDAEVTVSTAIEGDGQQVNIKVEPGMRVRVRKVSITLEDAANDNELPERLQSRWRMREGEPFRQSTWDDAKNQLLNVLQEDRFPAARYIETRAEIDADQHAVDISITIQRGAPHAFGALSIEGAERYPADVARRLWQHGVGDPYSLKELLDYQERLQRSGLYDNALVEAQPVITDRDAATGEVVVVPYVVKLREKRAQSILIGLGYSADKGQRVELEHRHLAPFGWEWIARNKVELARESQSLVSEWISYPLASKYRNLVSVAAEKLSSTGSVVRDEKIRVGRIQDSERIERFYYAELVHSVVEANTGNITASAVTGNYQWIWRDINSLQFPTRGLTVQAQAGVGIRYGSENDKKPFSRFYGRFTFYQPLGSKWFGQARLEAGRILSNEAAGIPDTLLFRAGGDDSVRGYAYRSLGVDKAGTILGGRVLLTSSVEIARSVAPSWLAAAFIDAGGASDNTADWRTNVGYGVGARWRSPVGPFKFDLAYAHQLRRFRLHLSVGVVF